MIFKQRGKIANITATEILDSRGSWTVRSYVTLEDGTVGWGEVPSGISTGHTEAALLPVPEAVRNINNEIAKHLKGKDALSQKEIDRALIDLDGTKNKSRLGANAILSVSLAVSTAAAKSQDLPIYQYLKRIRNNPQKALSIPNPMILMLEGGRHAKNERDIQEYMVCPKRTSSFKEQLKKGVKIYRKLKEILDKKALSTAVGVEGGFGPQKPNTVNAFITIEEAIKQAEIDEAAVEICLDIAANSLTYGEAYKLAGIGQIKSTQDLLVLYRDLRSQFSNLASLEDPFSEEDLDGWKKISSEFDEIMIVSDDLTVTNPRRLSELLPQKLFNSVIIKPNQIGTLTETIDFARMAQEAGLKCVVSHRAGETNSAFIADLAVGIGAEYVKFGAPARGERIAKYNRLLEIEKQLETDH